MNTLQEASRIYKAFQEGRPTFGGWQVSHPEDETKLDAERLTAL
jgi:4-hydroxy-2-oxoheptanedioate aldolase